MPAATLIISGPHTETIYYLRLTARAQLQVYPRAIATGQTTILNRTGA